MHKIPSWLKSFLLGVLLTTAQAPVNFWPAPFIAFPLLLKILDQKISEKNSGAAVIGWWFAFGFFVSGLYWIASSMLVEVHKFWWAIPFSVMGLPAYLALYPGLAIGLWQTARKRFALRAVESVLLFAVFWALAEWARGHLLTGFPWLMASYGWQGLPGFEQSLALVGAYGLSLITVTLSCLAWLYKDRAQKSVKVFCILSAIFFIAVFTWGEIRLELAPRDVMPIRLRIVQPNISQKEKLDSERHVEDVEKLLAMSREAPTTQTTFVIWPEASVPFYPQFDEELRRRLQEVVPSHGLLFFGGPAREGDGKSSDYRYYNSLFAIDTKGGLVARYDKSHLVPFGEFFPLRAILKKIGINISSIAAGALDFSFGSGRATDQIGSFPPFSPLICYEIIFSAEVVHQNPRPQWILNLTNDSWFGTTSGPYQHLGMARARAIEEGLPVVRAANTGISAIIDAYGRTQISLGLDHTGVIEGVLPTFLKNRTVFSRFGHSLFWLLIIFFVTEIIISFASRKNV